MYENETVIDQWVEENGKTRYQEFDGTERKDGGCRNEVPDLDWDSDWDTADKDYADRENEDWDAMVAAMEGELHDQIQWLYNPTPQMFSQLETLAHQWAKDNHILPYIANEAIAAAIADIKRRKESVETAEAMIEQVIEKALTDAVRKAYNETARDIKLLLNPRWLSRKDAAAHMGISVATFDTIAAEHLTPVIFIGFDLTRYDREQIDKLMVTWQSPPKRTKTK